MPKGKYEQWLTDEGLLQLEAWARNGLTDEQIAINIGIRRETLYDWIKKHPNISNALKKGKDVVDIQVENALLKRALGYSTVETIEELVTDYDPKTGIPTGSHMQVTRRVTKEVHPDTTAQIFWLKNRKPEIWRDKKDIDVAGTLNASSSLTDDELEERISKLKSKLGLESD